MDTYTTQAPLWCSTSLHQKMAAVGCVSSPRSACLWPIRDTAVASDGTKCSLAESQHGVVVFASSLYVKMIYSIARVKAELQIWLKHYDGTRTPKPKDLCDDFFPVVMCGQECIRLSQVPLYCTSNFSILSLFLCLLSLFHPPLSEASEWRLRIAGRLLQSELLSRNAYIWSLTPSLCTDGVAGTLSECGIL